MHLKTRQKILGAIIVIALIMIFFPFSFGHRDKKIPQALSEHFPTAPTDPNMKLPPPAKIVYEDVSNDQNTEVVPLVPPANPAPAPPSAVAPVAAATSTPVAKPSVMTAPVVQPALTPPAPPKKILVKTALPKPSLPLPKVAALPSVPIRSTLSSDNFLASDAAKAPSAVLGVHAWIVQLGSFKKLSDTNAVVARLRQKGYTAFSGTAMVNGAKWYRVYVGPMSTEKQALDIANDLQQKQHMSGYVHTYDVSN